MSAPLHCKALLTTIALSAQILAMDVAVTGPESDSAIVGKAIAWTASSSGAGNPVYRFRVRRPGGGYQMIRDFGPLASLDWAPDREGLFELEVSVKNAGTSEIATVSETVSVASRVDSGLPEVNSTDHPLVFLFSAPACPSGSRMRVRMQAGPAKPVLQTPFKPCLGGASMNFYLAGLYAETSYYAYAEWETGDKTSSGPSVEFRTGTVPPFSWNRTVVKAAAADAVQQVLLATSGVSQFATDLNGKVLWFNPSPLTYATSFDPGGYLWGVIEDDRLPVERQGIRKVDLLGRTVLETNAARVNEQLAAMGRRPISAFHHEVRTLPDGRVVALGSVEQLMTDVQEPGTVDVLGDMVIVFDRNLQVVWTWDAFDHLDVRRKAILGETCAPQAGGCPPFYLAAIANDWTHGNAVRPTLDGHLLYSSRHQDWLIKIDYADGGGDGHIHWRLGKDGDFTIAGSEPYPWFSHQHDGNFEFPNRLVVFDNGNTRIAGDGGKGNSRGQVIRLDEQSRTASLAMNADLGVYSWAVGSAQRLRNGDYHFEAGYVPTAAGLTALSIQVDRQGRIVSSIGADTLLYRSMRLSDMYSPF